MELLEKLAVCVEFGKINIQSPFPPDMKGQVGADELTKQAIDEGINPSDILSKGLIVGMEKVGRKFSENKVFVPQMLMSAKAMSTAMVHLKPFFQSGEVKRKGTLVIGTVAGDLHDIGKNLVAMMIEGGGWEVINLGVDVKTEKFMEAIEQHPNCVVGMSALLTTTMVNMEKSVMELKQRYPNQKIIIGGAPVNKEFQEKIGADFCTSDPQDAINFLNKLVA